MRFTFHCGFSTHDSCPAHRQKEKPRHIRSSVAGGLMSWLAVWLLVSGATVSAGNFHNIILFAEKLADGLYGYRLSEHKIKSPDGTEIDITHRYVTDTATIPGPTLILDEGDIAEIELLHKFDPDSSFQEHVSLHVHGVHYDMDSDGTLKYINFYKDQSAVPHYS